MTSSYTCVIEVHSMQGLVDGWRIVGDETAYEYGDVRVISFVGEHKSGKSFLMDRMVETTPKDQGVHTVGLGVSSKNIVTTPSVVSTTDNLIILDTTEGNPYVTSDLQMYDDRARMLFLYQMQLELANKLVFVTSNFNSKTQWNIKKLTFQLSLKPEKKITDKNKLIIIHNFMDVNDNETLMSRIEEVSLCYKKKKVSGWRRLKMNVSFQDKEEVYNYYQSDFTYHLFLVKHSPDDWNYRLNYATCHILRELLSNCKIPKFKIKESFLNCSNDILGKVLKEWDDTYELREDAKVILPFRKPSSDSIEYILGNSKQEISSQEKLEDEHVKKLELNNFKVTDTGEIITENDECRLIGYVSTSESEYIIYVFAPGVVDINSFSLKFQGLNTVIISVNLPSLLPNSDVSTEMDSFKRFLKGGKTSYKHTFPVKFPFKRPCKDDIPNIASLKGGVLIVRLMRSK